MSDCYVSALKAIERQAREEFSFDDKSSYRLFEITDSMCHEVVSDNDYLKLLELYYQKYAREGNRKNMLYCLLRMQQVLRAKEHRFWQKKFHQVEFQPDLEESVAEFLKGKKDYLSHMRQRGMIPLTVIDFVIYIVMLCLFVFGLHFSFLWSLILSFGIWAFILFYSYFVIVEVIISDQLNSMARFVDGPLAEFDKKRACDSFKVFHK